MKNTKNRLSAMLHAISTSAMRTGVLVSVRA